MQSLKFSIILPVYNQSLHIQEIIKQYDSELQKFPAQYEIILVVNGGKDNSLEICQKLSQEYKFIRVVHLKQTGWGLAVKKGIAEASGDFICYTNSARTQAKDLLLFLLYAYTNQQTVIKANRKIRESWQRRIGSFLYNVECRTLLDLPYWDINGTPKIFPRECKELLSLSREDDLIDVEFNYICKKFDYPMIEIPVFSFKRHGGKSTTGYNSAFKMYWGVFLFWLKARRLESHG